MRSFVASFAAGGASFTAFLGTFAAGSAKLGPSGGVTAFALRFGSHCLLHAGQAYVCATWRLYGGQARQVDGGRDEDCSLAPTQRPARAGSSSAESHSAARAVAGSAGACWLLGRLAAFEEATTG